MSAALNSHKSLSTLFAGIHTDTPVPDQVVSDITMDSRNVTSGSLFLALPGGSVDGRDFIAQALRAGASAVACDTDGDRDSPVQDKVFPVTGLRAAAGILSDRFFDSPSSRLKVVGITGTNGKSTCALLGAQAMQQLGYRGAVIGTLGSGFPGALAGEALTTPDVVTCHKRMAALLCEGADHVWMEVSSHALDQGRIDAVRICGAVFTNLSRDHLDYHGDMSTYGAAKTRLFQRPGIEWVVLNADDPFSDEIARNCAASRIYRYGLGGDCIRLEKVTAHDHGLTVRLLIQGRKAIVDSRLIGRFNAMNLAAVAASLVALEFEHDDVLRALRDLDPVPGRMEVVSAAGAKGNPLVVVDYAHTPDALTQALSALREHTQGQLWCVFGCGGDRDKGKRPLMGAAASALSDRVVITDDNPRGEDPGAIHSDIVSGVNGAPGRTTIVPQRREAIRWAIENTVEGDAVLIAGKGHESFQIIDSRKLPFSDREVAIESLEARR